MKVLSIAVTTEKPASKVIAVMVSVTKDTIITTTTQTMRGD